MIVYNVFLKFIDWWLVKPCLATMTSTNHAQTTFRSTHCYIEARKWSPSLHKIKNLYTKYNISSIKH